MTTLQVTQSEEALALLETFFNESRWGFQRLPARRMLRAGCRGQHGTWICYAWVDELTSDLIFQTALGLCISPFHREAVQDYLFRANALLMHNAFSLDLHSGDIRLTGTLPCQANLQLADVREMAMRTVTLVDRFFPGIIAVVHGGLSPDLAISHIKP